MEVVTKTGLTVYVYKSISLELWYLTQVFIGGGNWSTRRKPPTCHKSLANFIT